MTSCLTSCNSLQGGKGISVLVTFDFGGFMNNKVKGTQFEREVCEELAKRGYWVHFMSPDNTGAQPFDIIAVKYGVAFAMDCKTCDAKVFSINRLEDNQIMAFEKWLSCGNNMPFLMVKHENVIYCIPYRELEEKGKVVLNADYRWE